METRSEEGRDGAYPEADLCRSGKPFLRQDLASAQARATAGSSLILFILLLFGKQARQQLSLCLCFFWATGCYFQTQAAGFAKPPALAVPAGSTIQVSTLEQLYSAAENMTPGATLMIEPGVYMLYRPIVLSQKKDITIRSASGDPASVTLQGIGWVKGDDHDDIIHIGECDGVLIAGLTFAECRSYGVKVEAEHGPSNIQIYNCRFQNIGIRAIKGSAGQNPEVVAMRGSVRFCDFENTRVPPSTWLFGGDYIAAIDMMALRDWSFTDNIFRNINGRNGGGRAAIFVWVRSRNIVVERNVIVNCDRGISFGNPGQSTANNNGEPLTYVADGVIRNNIIVGGPDCGIELWHANRIKVSHNSIWRPERNWNRGIRIGTGTAHTEIVNNLVHGGIQNEGGDARLNHNLASDLDGFFEDTANGNLSLTKAATGAIDQGVVLNDVPRDFRGNLRKGAPDLGALEFGADPVNWIDAMKKVHGRFKGVPGTFAQFGDSITFSGAFWSPLAAGPKNMDPATSKSYRLVKKYLKPECLNQKGPAFGNQGSMTTAWAQANISNWLKNLDPEVAVIMFGSNDVRQMSAADYEKRTREVVAACLANGTIVLLTTPPPQTAELQKSLEFAAAIRAISSDLKIPLIDYSDQIFRRRPADWDGSSPEFKNIAGDTYEVPALISRDGVHPSNPQKYVNDFSEFALRESGYTLRNYLTMSVYADVIRNVIGVTTER
jgi:lysophospholipase L1-like esterase